MPDLWPTAWPLQFAQPLWLAGLLLVPLIWWLHRFAGEGPRVAVASLTLWREASGSVDAAARRASHADPAWRRRALIAALLVAALAQPQWMLGEPPLTIWVDNSASLFTVENGRTRLATLIEQARRAAGASRTATWRTLGDPSATILPGAIVSSLRLQPPVPSLLPSNEEHWLLTDGASDAVRVWAARAPLSRILTAGAATSNSAIVGLTARTDVAANTTTAEPGLTLAITVHNAGANTDERTLTLVTANDPLATVPLSIPPDERITHLVPIDGGTTEVTARLSRGDNLADDDVAVLRSAASPRPAVAVSRTCPAALGEVIASHPGIERATGASGDIAIACGPRAPSGSGPALWFFSDENGSRPSSTISWTPFADYGAGVSLEHLRVSSYALPPTQLPLMMASNAVIAGFMDDARTQIVSGLDLENDGLVASPLWPVLFAALLDTVAGRELLPRELAAQTVASADIAPRTMAMATADIVPQPATHSLVPWLLAAAAALLIFDWFKLSVPRPWHAAMRLAAAVLLVAALVAPTLVALRAPSNVIVLLDASYSRSSEQREAGWAAVREQLATVRSDSRVSILRFGRSTVAEYQ
ncbi:MAG: BatA domain-containing protein, partial [Pseudomonadota bacterium]